MGAKEHTGHYITSFPIHRILMTFGHTVHLCYRTKLYWIHQNLPPTWCLLGWNWVAKEHTEHLLSIHIDRRYLISTWIPIVFQRKLATSFISDAERRCIKPIEICDRLDVVVHGVKLGCKHAQGIYVLIYTQDLNGSRSFSVDCRVRTVCNRWSTRPMNSTFRCRSNTNGIDWSLTD